MILRWCGLTRRDRWIESDWFQVDLDTRRDLRTGFFFAVNAAGVMVDGVLYDENQQDADWDGVWEAQVSHPLDDYDFTSAALNLGAVLRWEYQPGSVAYLVYTGAFGESDAAAEFRFGRVFERLLDQGASHTLMLKLSYLWG